VTCRKRFTVTVSTVFADSKIALNKWLLGVRLMAGSKKSISAHQVHRSLGITYKSAWFMGHRIREAMDIDGGPLGGANFIVEADSTFVGGKAKNRATRSPARKNPVVALIKRDGRVASKHVANVTAANVRPLIVGKIDRASHLMTDESMVFTGMGREFSGHETVNQGAGEYVRTGSSHHTNTVENFFSIFKRSGIGTYHHMSEAHLGRYCAEFDFRYNTRKITDAERTDAAMMRGRGKRLTYRRPHAA